MPISVVEYGAPVQQQEKTRRLCDAIFHIGQLHLSEGKRQATQEMFEEAVNTYSTQHGAFIIGNRELQRLMPKK